MDEELIHQLKMDILVKPKFVDSNRQRSRFQKFQNLANQFDVSVELVQFIADFKVSSKDQVLTEHQIN